MPRNANDFPKNPVKITHIKISTGAATVPAAHPAAKPAAKPAPKAQ
jgi:hypothetical protein